MADRWQLLTEHPDERAAFASLAATSTWPRTAAAPPNRLRHVERLVVGERVYFLKHFQRTQWKNRLRFACSSPRARDDAEREALVALALRRAGFAVARPVACGRAGAASFYVCAELTGRPLHEHVRHSTDVACLREAAVHAGKVLAAGFWLPDLGADHLFVLPDGSFGLLDLHNGSLGQAGPAPAWVLRRVLRRTRRSCHELPLAPRLALALAIRLLRHAGCRGAAARRVLRRLPPWSTAQRYDAPGKSRAYADRNPERTARELELLARVWPGREQECVLDLPCGAGRLEPWLRARGHRVLQADGSLAMVQQAAQGRSHTVPAAIGDALAMPFADAVVDGLVMFRFLHHLEPERASLAIGEACRVAARFVVVSFFHPCSAHHLQRRLKALAGATTHRHAMPLGALRRRFARHGFALHAHTAEHAFVRDLWLAAFVRSPALATAEGKR